MKLPGKAIAAIAVVALLATAAVFMQQRSASARAIKLSSSDVETIVSEMLPPAQQARLASDPEMKKDFLKSLKRILALGQVAKQENYEENAETKTQLDFRTDIVLFQAYKKKNPDASVTDDDINAYFQEHPDELNEFFNANPQFKQQADQVKKEIGQIRVLANRARKDGLDKEKAVELSLLVARSQVLADAYFRDLQKNSDKLVSDENVEQYYNEHKDEFEEVHARHILVSTRAPEEMDNPHDASDKDQKKPAEKKAPTKEEAQKKAQALLDRIRKGEDFAKLAKENSDDPGSKTKGGDLDFFSKGDMVPQFDEVAFKLSPGQVSDLVETQFGFHIIKVEEKRTGPLDEKAKEKIKSKLEQEAVEKRIDEIVSQAKVEIAEDFTVNATPQQPAFSGNPHQQGR
jgi:parvulin-like peptidyl-prolyl isomerase